MRRQISLAATLLVLGSAVAGQSSAVLDPIPCDVTHPNGKGIPSEMATPGLHGNDALSVGLWPEGTVVFKPGGPGSVLADGALAMKFGWRRGVKGRLTIDGRRLDAAGPPLRAHIPEGNGDVGLQPVEVVFPVPGCWEVVGHVADAHLSFVTRVVLISDGPTRRAGL